MADAVAVRNLDSEATECPKKYGSGHLFPGASMLIADTLANVQTAFGSLPSSKLELKIVSNGSGGAGVVSPSGSSFISAEMVGTGSSQNIPHGLGGTPSKVNVTPVGLRSGETGRFTYTEGAHDSTNVVLTVPAGRRYKVVAS